MFTSLTFERQDILQSVNESETSDNDVDAPAFSALSAMKRNGNDPVTLAEIVADKQDGSEGTQATIDKQGARHGAPQFISWWLWSNSNIKQHILQIKPSDTFAVPVIRGRADIKLYNKHSIFRLSSATLKIMHQNQPYTVSLRWVKDVDCCNMSPIPFFRSGRQPKCSPDWQKWNRKGSQQENGWLISINNNEQMALVTVSSLYDKETPSFVFDNTRESIFKKQCEFEFNTDGKLEELDLLGIAYSNDLHDDNFKKVIEKTLHFLLLGSYCDTAFKTTIDVEVIMQKVATQFPELPKREIFEEWATKKPDELAQWWKNDVSKTYKGGKILQYYEVQQHVEQFKKNLEAGTFWLNYQFDSTFRWAYFSFTKDEELTLLNKIKQYLDEEVFQNHNCFQNIFITNQKLNKLIDMPSYCYNMEQDGSINLSTNQSLT